MGKPLVLHIQAHPTASNSPEPDAIWISADDNGFEIVAENPTWPILEGPKKPKNPRKPKSWLEKKQRRW